MGNYIDYINRFFDDLEMFEDVSRGHSYKAYLRQSVSDFLEGETKNTAFEVYRSFFDSYRINLEGQNNPFIDLLDVLLSYEERASTLIDKQRDHYVHSVNVFLLGLSIYAQNASFRDAFNAVNLDKEHYPFSYDTQGEEFFYRWGIASLFHDVGYPVEIIGKQLNKFIGFATEIDQGGKIKTHLEFDDFSQFNSIAEIIPRDDFTRTYRQKFPDCGSLDLLNPNDLLAHKLHHALGLDLPAVKSALDGFPQVMAKHGFIDHGYYSAIIVLRWYSYLIQSCGYKPEYFFYPILDSASAILLHNYYKNVLQKPPFDKGPLSPREHPIAYLLILCDELQEWNRTPYGIQDKKRNLAEEASLEISDGRLDLIYIDKDTPLPDEFAAGKKAALTKLLKMDALFADGFSVQCQTRSGQPMRPLVVNEPPLAARHLLEDLEQLAAAIHDLYNQKQLERHPDQPLTYPLFSDLPDTLKYSNLRQARGIAKKLALMAWEMRPSGTEGEIIQEIPEAAVEALAIIEHEDWMAERLESGWTYGDTKDEELKTSPYLVPYHELSEEIKDLDRDTVRNIPVLLNKIDMAIYRKDQSGSPAADGIHITRRLPGSYID